MRFIVGLLACAGLGGLSAALADPPASPASGEPAASSTPAAAPATPASTSTASPAAAAAPASSAAPAVSNKSAEAVTILARRMKAAGYHEEMHNGTKTWCRDEAATGSRLVNTKFCATPAQLDEFARQTQYQLREQLNLQQNCANPGPACRF
jgi:hypothetical protein